RSAGSHAGLRAGPRFRRARPPSQPCAARRPGIIVRFGRIFWRALALGNVAQIDPDASLVGRSAAHRVDEDIVHVQPRRRFRIPGLPLFEARERVRLTRRLGNGDEWLGRLTVAAAFTAGEGEATVRSLAFWL